MTCSRCCDVAFTPTAMSVLENAGSLDPARRSRGLWDFVEQYSPPLVAHLIRRRLCARDEALDFVHDFFLEKLIEPRADRNFVRRFLERKNSAPELRFRAYLVASLNNFVIDRKRRLSLPCVGYDKLENEPAIEAPALADPFEIDWALNLLNRAIELVECECHASGQHSIWQILNRRILIPACTGDLPPTYEELVVELKLGSAKQACNRLQTGIRKFQRVLYQLVDAYLPRSAEENREAQILGEVADLARVLDRRHTALASLAAMDSSRSEPLCAGTEELLQLGDSADDLWQADRDYAGLWLHCLRLPFVDFLSSRYYPVAAHFLAQPVFMGHSLRTLADVTRHPTPPLELVAAIKNDAKASLQCRQPSPTAPFLPRPMYHAIYTLAIAIARVRFGVHLTRYSDGRFASYLQRAVGQEWLDSDSRQVLEVCTNEIAPNALRLQPGQPASSMID
jgi:hypothetical protein